MSMLALTIAIRNTLRAAAPVGLGYRPVDCELMPDGMPPAASGEFFVAVHPGPWSTAEIEGLAETMGCFITVSVRGSKAPVDRWGTDVLAKATTGLLARCEAIRTFLHLDVNADALLAAMNALIGNSANGFTEPLRILDGGTATKRGGSWWYSDGKESLAGLSQTMTFGSAARYQRIEAMT